MIILILFYVSLFYLHNLFSALNVVSRVLISGVSHSPTMKTNVFAYFLQCLLILLSSLKVQEGNIIEGFLQMVRSESLYESNITTLVTLSYRVDPSTMTIMIEKDKILTGLCADSLNETVIDILCEQFGFGQPLKALPPISKNLAYVWTVDCLRDPRCFRPPKMMMTGNDINDSCHSVLRCSDCYPNVQFACRSTGYCIPAENVCNGFNDCDDGSDEAGCTKPKWRLTGSNETNSGRVQIFLQDSWADVCIDGLDQKKTDTICKMLRMGKSSRILPLFTQYATSTTYKINCTNNKCLPKGIGNCQEGILNLRCVKKNEHRCGLRWTNHSAPASSSKRRFARVVSGFSTVPGGFPWTAALKYKLGNVHHCGATVIARKYLLTAAHCFQ